MKDAFAGLLVPLRALAVALVGAWGAWLWFEGSGAWAIVIGAVALGIVFGVDAAGKFVPLDRPRVAIWLMESWILAPMVLAAAAAAAVIVLTVNLTQPEGTDPALKATVGAVTTAITAFLASGFIDWAADSKDSKLSDRIQSVFERRYRGVFTPESAGQRFVYAEKYGGVNGWGHASRRKRADGIKARWAADKRS